MELTPYFKAFAEGSDYPLVICDTELRIIYLNSKAANAYNRAGGYDMVGKNIEIYISIEAMSKLNMVLEWFKEDPENNSIFAKRIDETNTDMYIVALRDENQNLIGICSRHICRTPDTSEPYDFI